jgi:hypothetical protein
MSEQLHEDEYTPKVEQRSLYGEQQLSHDYEKLTMAQLQEKFQQFNDAILEPSTLSAHKAIYAECLDLLIFEIDWRISRNIER